MNNKVLAITHAKILPPRAYKVGDTVYISGAPKKYLGDWKIIAVCVLDGREWNEFPV